MRNRLVSFAGTSIIVEWNDPQEQALVEFLYRDVDADDNIPPHATLRLERDGPRVRLSRDETQVFETSSTGTLASVLVGQTIHYLCDKLSDGIALHAAAVSQAGAGMLMPGHSGVGKTTLAAWLSKHGFAYLTDELVFIARDSIQLSAFTRPLCLKERGLLALQQAEDIDYASDQVLTGPGLTMLPSWLLNTCSQQKTSRLALIVFPRFQAGSKPELLPLSKAQAGLALMESLVNARNLDDHGFGDATRIARSTPAYRLTYGSFAHLPQIIRQLGFRA